MHVSSQREEGSWLWELLPPSPFLWQADKSMAKFSPAPRALKRSLDAGWLPRQPSYFDTKGSLRRLTLMFTRDPFLPPHCLLRKQGAASTWESPCTGVRDETFVRPSADGWAHGRIPHHPTPAALVAIASLLHQGQS